MYRGILTVYTVFISFMEDFKKVYRGVWIIKTDLR